jgi:hypothetical protein
MLKGVPSLQELLHMGWCPTHDAFTVCAAVLYCLQDCTALAVKKTQDLRC